MAEEIQTRTAKHRAFQHLQTIDVPLDWAGTPRQGHSRFDRCIVALETFRYASKRGQRARRCLLQPRLEPLRRPGPEELGKVLGECHGLREGRVCLRQPIEQRLGQHQPETAPRLRAPLAPSR